MSVLCSTRSAEGLEAAKKKAKVDVRTVEFVLQAIDIALYSARRRAA